MNNETHILLLAWFGNQVSIMIVKDWKKTIHFLENMNCKDPDYYTVRIIYDIGGFLATSY